MLDRTIPLQCAHLILHVSSKKHSLLSQGSLSHLQILFGIHMIRIITAGRSLDCSLAYLLFSSAHEKSGEYSKTFIDYKLKQFASFSEWHSVDLLTSLYYGYCIFILAFTEDPENSVLVFFRLFTCIQYLHE